MSENGKECSLFSKGDVLKCLVYVHNPETICFCHRGGNESIIKVVADSIHSGELIN